MNLLGRIVDGVKALNAAHQSYGTWATDDPEFAKFLRIHERTFGTGYGYGSMSLDRAFCLTTYLSVIKIIAEDCASLPLFINRERSGRVDLDKSYPVYRLLHDSPNPDMTAIQLRERVTSHALTSGTGYIRIERSQFDSNRIIALWPMEPDSVTKTRNRADRVVYVESQPKGPDKQYQQSEVMELAGFGIYDEGLDMLKYMRQTIGLGLSQQDFAGRFFAQQQIPPLVLEHPQTTDVESVKAAWAKANQGPHNWHAPAVLQEGLKATLLQYDMTKTQLDTARAFQLLEICRPYRMPPHKLADLGRATWGNLSAEDTRYFRECLRPWLVRWEQAINKWIIGEDHPEWYAEHEIAGMLRGDFSQQTEGFRTLLASGVHSINEVRGLLNYNPIPGGDEHFIQINQGTVENIARGLPGGTVRVGAKGE